MTRNTTSPLVPPSLDDLMVRFLATRSDAASSAAVETAGGDVEPHEVAAGFRVDPRAAWTDAVAALAAALGSTPTEWAALVAQPWNLARSPALAVTSVKKPFPLLRNSLTPFCCGTTRSKAPSPSKSANTGPALPVL